MPEGILIDFAVPYEDIAAFCGISTRNSVNRLITQLRADGLLELRNHHLLIPSLDRLRRKSPSKRKNRRPRGGPSVFYILYKERITPGAGERCCRRGA